MSDYHRPGWWVVDTPRGPAVIELDGNRRLSTLHPASRFETEDEAHDAARQIDPDWTPLT